MIRNFIEFWLLGAWNSRQKKRQDLHQEERPCESSPEPLPLPPEDAAALGHILPLVPGERERDLWLTTSQRCTHLAITGATGSGKTTALRHLLRADFAARRATCLIDFNGDLMDGALAVLAATVGAEELRGRLLLLDLRAPSHLPALNVLQPSGDGDDAYTRALSLLEAIRRGSESFGVQLHETLLCCLIALAENGFSLLEIEPLLSNAVFRAHVVARTRSEYARSFFARYDALSSDKQATWRSPVLNKLAFLAHPDVRLLLGQRAGFSFRRFEDVPGLIVLVALDRPRLQGAADTVAALISASLLQTVIGRSHRPGAERTFLHIALDEAQHFAGEDLNVLLTEGRRYGVALSLAHQNLSQMPSGTSAIIRNNAGTRLFFATGAPDAAEIAREVVLAVPPDMVNPPDVRELLLTQPAGQCLVARRGQKTVLARILPPVSDPISSMQIEAMRAIARENFARSRTSIDNELSARARWLAALARGEVAPSSEPKLSTRTNPTISTLRPSPSDDGNQGAVESDHTPPLPIVEVRSSGRGRGAP